MNHCSKCGREFEGNFCPDCGTKVKNISTCPKCGTPRENNSRFCANCGYDFEKREGEKKPQSKAIKWIKSHLKVLIPVSLLLVTVIVILSLIPTFILVSANGTYYEVGYDGEPNKENYYVLKGGKWNDSDFTSGTYTIKSGKITLSAKFFGETITMTGTVKGGVLRLKDPFGGDSESVYISKKHKHKYTKWETETETACNHVGVEIRTCSSCGAKERKEIEALPHSFGAWKTITEPTCTEDGLRQHTCIVCENTYNETIPANGHTLSDEWTITETDHRKICSACGETIIYDEHKGAGSCTVCGYEYGTSAGLKYTLSADGKSYTLIGIGACQDTTLIIPATYNFKPVTNIESGAFEDCSGLTSVTIPNSVTSIGGWVFTRCSRLTDITYNGTKTQWKAISKDIGWNWYTGNYTVHCTDGDIAKEDS